MRVRYILIEVLLIKFFLLTGTSYAQVESQITSDSLQYHFDGRIHVFENDGDSIKFGPYFKDKRDKKRVKKRKILTFDDEYYIIDLVGIDYLLNSNQDTLLIFMKGSKLYNYGENVNKVYSFNRLNGREFILPGALKIDIVFPQEQKLVILSNVKDGENVPEEIKLFVLNQIVDQFSNPSATIWPYMLLPSMWTW